VRAVLAGWAGEDPTDTAVLLTSEVVSNAVLHAGPHPAGSCVRVRMLRYPDRVRVEVTDPAPGRPARVVPQGDSVSGRGLLLLDALSAEWGIEPEGSGKVVWFEVAV
jgi:anti-sigma regulatory factor (Ser/Thr protein kinase)